MECDICSRKDVAEVGMYCPSCARTSLYALRLEAVRILSEKQAIGRRVEHVTSESISDPDARRLREIWKSEVNKTDVVDVKEKIEEKKAEVASLRVRIHEMQDQVADRRNQVKQKSAELSSIKSILLARQHKRLEQAESLTGERTTSWDANAAHSLANRVSLCRETAKLLRLKRTRTRIGDYARDQYWISGFAIPDLRAINTLQCSELTATLAAYAHLLVLVAFYTGIQLPAEISLPHRNYPLGTINTPATSYIPTRKAFPGSGSALSSGANLSTSKQDKRPRPLFIGSDDEAETVIQFAKKDPTAFTFFVEGIALLAWNVTWLVQSQDSSPSIETWSDACKIGRNLYRLIFASQKPSPLPRMPSHRSGKQQNGEGQSVDTPPSGGLGTRSHSSAHDPLVSPGNKTASTLPTYTVISDSLRKTLITEGKDAEWEVLGDEEFDDGAERFDEAVVVKNRALDGKDFDDARSIITTRTLRGAMTDAQQANGLRAKGTSGWTKLKSRESTS